MLIDKKTNLVIKKGTKHEKQAKKLKKKTSIDILLSIVTQMSP